MNSPSALKRKIYMEWKSMISPMFALTQDEVMRYLMYRPHLKSVYGLLTVYLGSYRRLVKSRLYINDCDELGSAYGMQMTFDVWHRPSLSNKVTVC